VNTSRAELQALLENDPQWEMKVMCRKAYWTSTPKRSDTLVRQKHKHKECTV